MEDMTLNLLVEKMAGKLNAEEIEKLQKGDITPRIADAINDAIRTLERETREAREYSDKITSTVDTKVDALSIFWYAVGASLVVNILSSTLLHYISITRPQLLTASADHAIIVTCLILLALLYIAMSAEIIKLWHKGVRANDIVYRIFKGENRKK